MHSRFASMPVCVALSAISLLPIACTDSNTPTSSSTLESGEADTDLLRVSVDSHEVVFSLDREDLTLKSAVFSASCFQRDVTTQEEAAGEAFSDCDIFRINGEDRPGWHSTELEPTGLNRFSLPATNIDFSPDDEAYICLTVKPWFSEIPNEFDWYYYAEGDDRYSALSFCSVADIPDWGWDNARITRNRVGSLEEFTGRLAAPIEVQTSDRPLPPAFGSTEFRGSSVGNDELWQCGHAVPMPAGRVPEDQSSEPIEIPVGVYQGWQFSDSKTYRCVAE